MTLLDCTRILHSSMPRKVKLRKPKGNFASPWTYAEHCARSFPIRPSCKWNWQMVIGSWPVDCIRGAKKRNQQPRFNGLWPCARNYALPIHANQNMGTNWLTYTEASAGLYAPNKP